MKPTYSEAISALRESYFQMDEIRLYFQNYGDYFRSDQVARAQDNLAIVQSHLRASPQVQMEISLND